MGLTITNTNTFTLLNILNRNSAAQSNLLKQLTTGKRINSAKDDPAGLIALTSLNIELTAVNESLKSNQRTQSLLSVAESAVGEIQSLLGEIEKLVLQSSSSGNLTSAEIAANQSQIDDALTAIDRMVNATNFNGNRLIDGSFAIQVNGAAGNSYMSNRRVLSRSQVTSDTTLTVKRVASAQLASASFAFAGGNANTSGTTQVAITGSLGTATITLTSGLTQTEIVTAINAAKDQTGVSALQAATYVGLNSTGYGTDAYVSVEVLSGGAMGQVNAANDSDTSDSVRSSSKASGVDANITINGQTAGTDGMDVNYSANGLSFAFTLGDDFGKGNTGATTSTTFTVKASGGATFQLGTTASTRQTIGIDSLATHALGGGNNTSNLSQIKSGGTVELSADVEGALKSVKAALSEVAGVRARLGGFQKYQVEATISSLQSTKTGLQEAASVIGDTDYAMATAELNQQSVLVQSSMMLLGMVNQQSAQILSLLG